jgi:hypothetical protein
MNGKGPRGVAKAVRHYIAVLETALSHCCEDETAGISNDIGFYLSILSVLEQDRWPENRA